MNWDAIGAVGEVVGAIAVVISLIYLSVQVRSGTNAMRTSMRDSAFRLLSDWNYVLSADPELPLLFKRALRNPRDLTERELARFHHMIYSFFKIFENIYLHYLDKSVAGEAWDTNKEILLLYSAQPGAKEYWQDRRAIFDPRFRELVESSKGSSLKPSDQLFGNAD